MHCFLLLLVDIALVALSTLAAVVLCSVEPPFPALMGTAPYVILTLVVAVPALLILRLNRTVWRFTSMDDGLRVANGALAIVVTTVVLGFFLDRLQGVSRGLPIMQALLLTSVLGGARISMRIRHLRRRRARRAISGGTRKNVLIVGLNPLCDLFLDWAAEQGREKIEVVGILSDAERHRGRLLRSRKILGTPEQVEQSLHDFSVHGVVVDTIVVASPTKDLTEKARDALRAIETAGGVRIDYLSARYAFDEMPTHCANDGNRRYSAVTVSSPPQLDAADLPSASYLRWKRAVDAAGALVCLVCFAPVMAVVFVLVRIDVGAPAIFWQQRPGSRGKPIRVLKFRTMGPARNPEGRPLSDIERVSGVGRLLRRLRLDELPQVYNVLAGHMSFVGPRPLLPIDQPSAPLARLRIRPGLTGWAQIKGGRRLSIEDKAALDLWYIKNASLSLDLLILVETVRMILFGDRVDSRAVDAAWKDLHADEAASFSADMARSTSA